MRQSHHLIRNALFNLLGQLARVAGALVIPPFVVAQIGDDNYGLVTVVATFAQIIALVQIGTPQALTRFVAHEVTRKDQHALSRIVSTGMAMLIVMALAAAAVFMPVLAWPRWFLEVPPHVSLQTVQLVIAIMGIGFILGLPLSLGKVAFYACERFGILNAIEIAGVMGRVFLIFATLMAFNHSVIAYVAATSVAAVAPAAVIFVCGLLVLPEARLGWKHVRKDTFKQVIGYGIEVFLIGLAQMLYVQADILIVNKILGPAAVTRLSLALLCGHQMRLFMHKMVSVVVPFSAGKEAAGDVQSLRVMLIRLTKYALIAYIPVMIFVCVFRYALVSAWMGPGYEVVAQLLLPLFVADTFFMARIAGTQIFLGIGKIRFLTIMHLVLGPVNIVLVILFIRYFHFGLLGVAIAYVIVFVIGSGIVAPICMSRILGLSPISYYRQSCMRPILAGAALVPVAYLLNRIMGPDSWGWLALAGGAVALAYVPLAYVLALDGYDRQLLLDVLNRVLARIRKSPNT